MESASSNVSKTLSVVASGHRLTAGTYLLQSSRKAIRHWSPYSVMSVCHRLSGCCLANRMNVRCLLGLYGFVISPLRLRMTYAEPLLTLMFSCWCRYAAMASWHHPSRCLISITRRTVASGRRCILRGLLDASTSPSPPFHWKRLHQS